ncbi:MAG TPA: hypothetical protein VK846_13635, partial [Candidatus Limnocylindria bacterium]|nr:hypothetical protein [Candidatus Limnocylindria bacterium]
MKLIFGSDSRRGSSIVVVLVLCSITLLILGSALQWSSTNTTLSQRNNEYFKTIAVAEGATEKLLSRIVADYRKDGEVTVLANTNSYKDFVPTSSDNALLAKYEFSDGQGHTDKMFVQYDGPTVYKVLDGHYKDLHGYATPFRIISNAKQLDSLFQVVGAVRQDFELSTIPLFQFAIFYNLDLEIAPGADMEITGPVHSNEDVYIDPGEALTFRSDVTAAGNIYESSKYGSTSNDGTVDWGPTHKSKASSLNLPIGTTNTAAAVREVVEVPPSGESATSDLGKQRFYNRADMIIRIKANKQVQVTSGLANNFATIIPRSSWDKASNANTGFLTTNASFFNKREGKTVTPIEINVAKLALWNVSTNNTLKSYLTNEGGAGNLRMVYVVDERA